MATWNWGRHILPSIKSVLGQGHKNFELLVVGDAATDDTEKHVASVGDPRIRWINLEARWGTQSGPNNRGIEEARAPIVAYLGHDDIWTRDHLVWVLETFRKNPKAGAVCSGIICCSAFGDGPPQVTGFLDGSAGQSNRFFVPPSATAQHVSAIGGLRWPRREEVKHPVDFAYQKALVKKGVVFRATDRITVFKFVANDRYLSYFEKSTEEQEQQLARFDEPDEPERVAALVARAKATGNFMHHRRKLFPRRHNVLRTEQNRGIRGLSENIKITGRTILRQGRERRARDWLKHKFLDFGYRVSGPNPKPKMLIPALSEEQVRLRLDIRWKVKTGLPALELHLNGYAISHDLHKTRRIGPYAFGQLQFLGRLRTDRASVLIIDHLACSDATQQKHPQGIAVGNVIVEPCQMTVGHREN